MVASRWTDPDVHERHSTKGTIDTGNSQSKGKINENVLVVFSKLDTCTGHTCTKLTSTCHFTTSATTVNQNSMHLWKVSLGCTSTTTQSTTKYQCTYLDNLRRVHTNDLRLTSAPPPPPFEGLRASWRHSLRQIRASERLRGTVRIKINGAALHTCIATTCTARSCQCGA